ncbi:MAG: GatB/YqeY domain-containing protein [Clostridia bacterium]|nr:GatB/YqeY domain-containing protein [Clostridia bacterium]
MILDEIKKANMTALKEKNQTARAIYSVVMTKAMLETVKKREKGEELTDADMTQILQKTIKELTDEAESYITAGKTEQAEEIAKQKEIISVYLPKMLSEQEIYDIIAAQDDKTIPNIMKHFKANYAGKVDMSKVSAVLKQFN